MSPLAGDRLVAGTTKLAALFLCLLIAGRARGQHAPKPLPEELRAAWDNAGVTPGWIAHVELGPNFLRDDDEDATAWKVENLPAFRFYKWQAGVLSKLPPPQQGFGLSLASSEATDAGLNDLAGFKRLQTLDLSNTAVTDAGLKELRGLKELQTLYLTVTKVTDARLKELAGLKQLTYLTLGRTGLTDAGLKELAGFTQLQALDL